MKNLNPIIRALIDALLLLEFAGSSEINPDTAVRGMENIASSLLALEVSDQIQLRNKFDELADDEHDQVFERFIRSLPDMLGLASL